jgi:hypothetical protein
MWQGLSGAVAYVRDLLCDKERFLKLLEEELEILNTSSNS